jgi:hypothetical protein
LAFEAQTLIASLIVGALLAGCATTATTDTTDTQSITIKTPGVTAATCVLSSPEMSGKSVTAPATLIVRQRQDSIAVRCRKDCYEDGNALISASLFGGYPAETQITMRPIKGCRPPRA